MHVHVRQGSLLKDVLPFTANHFARALVMPNTTPAIETAEDVDEYKAAILACRPEGSDFEPLMTFKITPKTTVQQVKALKGKVVSGKLYPDGVTTNSEDGVSDFQALYPVFYEMQNCGIALCIHGEKPGPRVLEREAKFLPIIENILYNFSELKVVMEHVTTKEAVDFVSYSRYKNLAATITLHHLFLTLDDIIGGTLNPHAFCKPVAKFEEDRKALRKAAVGRGCVADLPFKNFFLGSDSAPHTVQNKECACGAAGIYSAPILLPALLEFFLYEGTPFPERHEDISPTALRNFELFVSENGARFYGLPLNEGTITLVKEPWQVPDLYSGVRPFKAGEILQWKIQEDHTGS